MGIYAALEISAVVRLKHTFGALKKKSRLAMDEFTALFEGSSSWKAYREHLKTLNEASTAVPYL